MTFKIDIFYCYCHVELCTKIACAFFYLTALLIDFLPIYRTSAALSDEMELWCSLNYSSQLQTLNFFHIELSYLISNSSGKTKNNASSLCHP